MAVTDRISKELTKTDRELEIVVNEYYKIVV